MPKIVINIVSIPEVFIELGQAIRLSLSELGHEAEIVINDIRYGDVTFFINGNLLWRTPDFIPAKHSTNILIQAEQRKLGTYQHNWTRVLELFPELVKTSNSYYFKMGYSKVFDQGTGSTQRYHRMFFGSKTGRRTKLIDRYQITWLRNVYAAERDAAILATTYNINLRAFPRYYYAPLHGLLVMCKGKVLFQEECQGGYGIYHNYLKLFNEHNLLDVCNKYDRQKLNDLGHDIRAELIKLNFTESLSQCLKGIL